MKRIFWASTGYALGLGSSVWVQRRVRRTVERYTPEQVRGQFREQAGQVADRARFMAEQARRTVIDLREAANEGRAAMRQSELDLRAEFGGGTPIRHGRPPSRESRANEDRRVEGDARDLPLRPWSH